MSATNATPPVSPDTAALRRRLAEILAYRDVFSANDITADGLFAADHDHRANSRQNAIGSLFQWAHRAELIEHAGLPTLKSTAPHRKGGRVEQWRSTAAGRGWARRLLEEAR